jgi:hypothetical protein
MKAKYMYTLLSILNLILIRVTIMTRWHKKFTTNNAYSKVSNEHQPTDSCKFLDLRSLYALTKTNALVR